MIISGELLEKIEDENVDAWFMMLLVDNEDGQLGIQVRNNNKNQAQRLQIGERVRLQVKHNFRIHKGKFRTKYHSNIILEKIR